MGIVLGIEMSRLARTGREWHQLLELCALSGALLAAPDGVYDPVDHNDRLLHGPEHGPEVDRYDVGKTVKRPETLKAVGKPGRSW